MNYATSDEWEPGSGRLGLLIATMQTKDQPKRGRPSDYSAEIADTICDGLADGKSLKARAPLAGRKA
jgi:hypothetical protein